MAEYQQRETVLEGKMGQLEDKSKKVTELEKQLNKKIDEYQLRLTQLHSLMAHYNQEREDFDLFILGSKEDFSELQ